MSQDETRTPGIVLLCSPAGEILQIVRDDLGATEAISEGQLLIRLVDPLSTGKILDFLVELKSRNVLLDWEINVPFCGEVATLHFGGALRDHRLLVFAAKSRRSLLELYEEIAQSSIAHPSLPFAGSATKQLEETRTRIEKDSALYDEISRLNNELVTLQRELAKQNVELEKLNQLKNQFLGMAAHDLRSPLGHILTYSQFLIDELQPELADHQIEFLSIIQRSSEFMLGMVEDLLDMARVESGKLQLVLRPTDLSVLLKQNAARNRLIAARKDIAIVLDCKEGLPLVAVDPDRIEQVLNNLIDNAIKYSPPRTTVTVGVNRREDHAVIRVKDQGVGIPPERVEELFKPFSRARSTGTGGEKGAGLGLSIVKKIVAGHAGDVWVQSLPGEGSVFSLSLPLPPPEVQPTC